ncbi:MAG: SDR family oxidoreductase [Vampirovibrio sp.]|nr:SDR family oxidoreductase [Vampirovibrio sp.]
MQSHRSSPEPSSHSTPQHCLVTGGAGFIGSHIIQGLLAQGHRVRVLDNLSSGSLDNLTSMLEQVDFVEGDIRDSTVINACCKGIDTVFHQAALVSVAESMTKPVLTHDMNVSGTLNVLEACRENGVSKIVFASSAAVYGEDPTLPKTESMIPQPVSPYAWSKWMGEEYCKMYAAIYGMQAVCLRYFNVFGPRQDPSSDYSGVMSKFTDAIASKSNPQIYGDGLQSRDFIYVGDVARANILAMEAHINFGIYNVATGTRHTLLEVLDHLKGYTGSRFETQFYPTRSGDIRHSEGSAEKIKTDLKFTPGTTFFEGLSQYLTSIGIQKAAPIT